MGLISFSVARTDELVFECQHPLSEYYLLSPCVWKEQARYQLLLRAVNRSAIAAEKVARIYHGEGSSPLHFAMDQEPIVAPGPEDDDRDGCEDPTLAAQAGCYYVYYSGWNQQHQTTHLLLAVGDDIHRLQKRGRVFSDTSRPCNAKEATIVRAADQTWRLFFEFAQDDASKIGVAAAASLDGPWTIQEPPFFARPGAWDSWHLSTGPVSLIDRHRPVMFYNGANRDAQWRVGWIEFDENFRHVIARCEQPIIAPPEQRRDPEDTDIAFAASAVEEGEATGLYYSIADRWVKRSLVVVS